MFEIFLALWWEATYQLNKLGEAELLRTFPGMPATTRESWKRDGNWHMMPHWMIR